MFKFGPYILDPAVIRLSKNGIEIELEPQLFNTLLHLIKMRDRVVTKDELLEKVWNGRVVSDHVITRVIYELRKILDDKSGEYSHIRTVRRKGYQFIVDVTEDEQGYIVAVPSESISILDFSFLNKLLIIFGIMVLAIGIFMLTNKSTSEVDLPNKSPSKQKLNIYPIIAVMPIDVESDNEELSMLVQSLIEYLTNQLLVNLNMKVIHPDNLLHMEEQLNDIRAIQKTTRSDFIIQGFIESVTDQSINLHLTLHKNNGTGGLIPFPLGAFKFPYPQNAKDLNELYKQRKVTVRSIIQIIKPGVIVRDNGERETDDPEAYRLVIAAHHLLRSDDCKAIQRAEQLLLNATQRDDQFAYAYYQLFANYFKRVWLCGESIEFHQKALAMAEIVQRLAPNSYNPMAMGMNAILIESNQVEKAYELSKDADWNDPDAINYRNYGLRYAGFLKLATQYIDRILQLDPYFFSEKPIHQAPNALLYQNLFTEYMDLLAEPGNSYHDYFRGLSLVLMGNSLEASKILQGVVERQSTDLFGKLSQALLFIIENDNLAAIEIVDKIVRQRNIKKLTDGEMTYKLVQLYALANAQELALKNLQLTVDSGFFPMNYFLKDPALKSIQNREEFSAIIEQATKRHKAFAEKFDLIPETILNTDLKYNL
jgi:DNA-binding winged helix-turn-helix (wHTH) protein/TolB-like protein